MPQTATFFAKAASDIPCALLGKLNAPLQLRAEMQQPVEVPKYARFLRGAFAPGTELGVVEQSEPKKRRRVEGNDGDGLDVYMYLFHVCFTGLHFVSWETILALRLTFAFLFGGTCLKKNLHNTAVGFACPCLQQLFASIQFHARYIQFHAFCFDQSWSSLPAARRAMLVRHPRRGIIGPSERFYQVFAAPQNRQIFTGILSFLTDSSGDFTVDIVRFSLCSAFLRFWTSIFKRVDTPSVAAEPTPVDSPVSSLDSFPDAF